MLIADIVSFAAPREDQIVEKRHRCVTELEAPQGDTGLPPKLVDASAPKPCGSSAGQSSWRPWAAGPMCCSSTAVQRDATRAAPTLDDQMPTDAGADKGAWRSAAVGHRMAADRCADPAAAALAVARR